VSGGRLTAWYASFVIVGTLFVTPLVGLGLARVGAPLTPALLGVLGVVLGGYALLVLWTGDVERGLLVAVLVLSTVDANVPLGALPRGVTVGPNLYLVDLPLVAFALVTLPTWRREHLTAGQALLGLYLVWTVLLVALAPAPRPDVAGWYAVHVARYTLAFALVTRAVVADRLSPGDALGVVLATAVGHALVASAQAGLGTVDGLTVLGANTRVVASFPMGPLGSVPSGPYVGGFTGGAPFAVHLTVFVPVVVAAVFHDRIPRVVALASAAWLALLLQLTAWDAARGALLVSLGLVGVVLGWWRTGVLAARSRRAVSAVRRSAFVERWRPLVAVGVAGAAGWQLLGPTAGRPHRPTYLPPEFGQAFARSVKVPGFETRNLAVRVDQYVGGVDTFLQYPLTGLGGANYRYVASSYAETANMVHSLYVGVLAETGLVGGLLFFGAMAYAGRAVWVTAVGADDPVYLGLLAGLGGTVALQFFQPQYLRATSFVPLWAILGVACGRYRRRRPVGPDRWSRAWDGSGVVAATGAARLSRSLVAVLGVARATVGSGRAPGLARSVRTRTWGALGPPTVGERLRSAVGSSVVGAAWCRLRSACADSWLYG
jgi:hypothetical protein